MRSGREVIGYSAAPTDGSIGHLEDFLFDGGSWAIRYVVVDTRDWWPGRHVLVSPEHVNDVSWEKRSVSLDIARAEVEQSPEYDSQRARQTSVAIRTWSQRERFAGTDADTEADIQLYWSSRVDGERSGVVVEDGIATLDGTVSAGSLS